jgi:hypothetical protein
MIKSEISFPADITVFISMIIESGLWSPSKTGYSFHYTFEILKEKEFQIEDTVDSTALLHSFSRAIREINWILRPFL